MGASSLVSPPLPLPDRTNIAAWYIDPANGNDANNGYTALTAFKTLSRWFQVSCSYGKYAFFTTVVTVNILGDLNAGDTSAGLISVGGIAGGGALRFVGTPTVAYTSSGAGVTVAAAVPAANSHWRLTDTNLADWAPYVSAGFSKYRVRMTDTNAIVWPASRTSAHVAVVSSPMDPDLTLGPYGQALVPLTNGEHFVIEALPVLNNLGLSFNVVQSNFNTPEPVTFQALAFQADTYVRMYSTSELGGQIGFYGCSFALTDAIGGEFVNCRTLSVTTERSSTFLAGLSVSAIINGNKGIAAFDQEYFLQDSIIASEGSSLVASVQLAGASAIDTDNAGNQQLIGFLAGGGPVIWGVSTLANIIRVEPNGKVTYFDTATMTAVGSGGANTAVCVGIPGSGSSVTMSYSALPYADAGTMTCVEQATTGADGGSVAVRTMMLVGGYVTPTIGEINTQNPLPRWSVGGNGCIISTMASDGVTAIPLLSLNGSNDAIYGSSSVNNIFNACSAQITFYSYGYGALITALPPGVIGLFNPYGGGVDTGSGTEILQLYNCTTRMSTTPTRGPIFQAQAGAVKVTGTSGTTTTIAMA